jgi:hypothetical protein
VSYNCPTDPNRGRVGERGGTRTCYKVNYLLNNYFNAKVTYLLCLEMFQCNEEGHLSYYCLTGPTRGRGGGRGGGGGGSTRPCFKVTSVTSIKLLLQN